MFNATSIYSSTMRNSRQDTFPRSFLQMNYLISDIDRLRQCGHPRPDADTYTDYDHREDRAAEERALFWLQVDKEPKSINQCPVQDQSQGQRLSDEYRLHRCQAIRSFVLVAHNISSIPNVMSTQVAGSGTLLEGMTSFSNAVDRALSALKSWLRTDFVAGS